LGQRFGWFNVIALTILALAPLQPLRARPAPLQLSRQQALDLGLSSSLNLRSSALTVAENQALVGLARSRFLPKLDLVALGTFAQVNTTVGFISNLPTIGDLSLNLGGDSSAVVTNTFVNLGLVFRLPLLDFARSPLQQATRAELEASQSEQAEQRRRTRFEILSRYLAAQYSSALIPVWQSALGLSQTLLRDVNAIRREGLAPRIDTYQAEAQVQSDLQGLAEARAQHEIALSALARILSLPADATVQASDPLRPDPAWRLSLEATLQQALQQRPALESLQRLVAAQQARVKLARATRLPSVGLLLGGGISGDWLTVPSSSGSAAVGGVGPGVSLPALSTSGSASGSFVDWGAAITVRQPLYDGGQSREAVALASRKAQQAELAVEQAQQAIIQSVETWYATHQATAAQAQAAGAAIKANERSVRDGLLRYRAGLAPITEVLLAQRNLQLARAAEATAIHRWNLSRAALELETGQP
jgi:outer membrane protein TolC